MTADSSPEKGLPWLMARREEAMEHLEAACDELRETNDPHATLALDDVLGAIQVLARAVPRSEPSPEAIEAARARSSLNGTSSAASRC